MYSSKDLTIYLVFTIFCLSVALAAPRWGDQEAEMEYVLDGLLNGDTPSSIPENEFEYNNMLLNMLTEKVRRNLDILESDDFLEGNLDLPKSQWDLTQRLPYLDNTKRAPRRRGPCVGRFAPNLRMCKVG